MTEKTPASTLYFGLATMLVGIFYSILCSGIDEKQHRAVSLLICVVVFFVGLWNAARGISLLRRNQNLATSSTETP